MFYKILFMDKVRQYKLKAKVTVKIQLKVVVVEGLEVAQGDEELLLLPQILVWTWCCVRASHRWAALLPGLAGYWRPK